MADSVDRAALADLMEERGETRYCSAIRSGAKFTVFAREARNVACLFPFYHPITGERMRVMGSRAGGRAVDFDNLAACAVAINKHSLNPDRVAAVVDALQILEMSGYEIQVDAA
jgi:hypothetical protein